MNVQFGWSPPIIIGEDVSVKLSGDLVKITAAKSGDDDELRATILLYPEEIDEIYRIVSDYLAEPPTVTP